MASATEFEPGNCKEEPQEQDEHDFQQQKDDQEADQTAKEYGSDQQKGDQDCDQKKDDPDSNQQKENPDSNQQKEDQDSNQQKEDPDSNQQKEDPDSNENNGDRGVKRKLEEDEAELQEKYLLNKQMKEVRIEMRCLIPSDSVRYIIGEYGSRIKMLAQKYHSELKVLRSDTRECILLVTASPRNFGELSFKLVPCMNIGKSRDNMQFKLLVHHSQVKHITEGDKIESIEKKFGARILMHTERMPGSTDQLCTISGTNKAINKCAMRIAKMLVHKAPPEAPVLNYNPGSNKVMTFENRQRGGGRGGPGPRGDFYRGTRPRGGFFGAPRGSPFRRPPGGPMGSEPRGFSPRGNFFGGPRAAFMRPRGFPRGPRRGFAPRGGW